MDVNAIVAACVVVLFGLGALIRGFQMGNGRHDLICDWDNQPLPSAAAHAASFARVYISLGVIFILSPLALWFGMPLLLWGIPVAALFWYWFEAIDRISARARSEDPTGNR